jgi:hypothetical protein
MSESASVLRVAIGIVVVICLAAIGLFLLLDPSSLDVHVVYGDF